MTDTRPIVCPSCRKIVGADGHWCPPPPRRDAEQPRTDSKPDAAKPRTDRFG